MRVLLSEAASLTAREHLSVLGPAGVEIDVAASGRLPIARFSRWCRRVVRLPRSGEDPKGYLAAIAGALRENRYDALLPTHEQAWLFAAGRHYSPGTPRSRSLTSRRSTRCRAKWTAVGCWIPSACRSRPGPSSATPSSPHIQLPCWLKAAVSTAGSGVRFVSSASEALRAFHELAATGSVLAQQPASGTYAQVAGLFAHGRLIAVHTQ